MSPATPRKRGAQPGNRNAHKHGFYSSQFKQDERRVLDAMSLADLSGEIELMRIETQRFLQAQAGLPPALDIETHLSILRAITLSIEAINSMVRTQYLLANSSYVRDQETIDELLSLELPPDDSLPD